LTLGWLSVFKSASNGTRLTGKVDIGPTKGLAKVPVKRICALGGEAIFSDKKGLKKWSRLADPTWKRNIS
jgi:hypothetical protein